MVRVSAGGADAAEAPRAWSGRGGGGCRGSREEAGAGGGGQREHGAVTEEEEEEEEEAEEGHEQGRAQRADLAQSHSRWRLPRRLPSVQPSRRHRLSRCWWFSSSGGTAATAGTAGTPAGAQIEKMSLPDAIKKLPGPVRKTWEQLGMDKLVQLARSDGNKGCSSPTWRTKRKTSQHSC